MHPGQLKLGDNLFTVAAKHGFELPKLVTIANIVPSIDTAVCEEQTHILGESRKIKKGIILVSISRDLPMAQARFAKAAKLENIQYFSDFKEAAFGKNTGLLIPKLGLLARAVVVTDAEGNIHHLEIVKDITTMPNMSAAIEVANKLM